MIGDFSLKCVIESYIIDGVRQLPPKKSMHDFCLTNDLVKKTISCFILFIYFSVRKKTAKTLLP